MRRFSERIGKRQTRLTVQKEEIDEILKNHIWNVFLICILNKFKNKPWKNVGSTQRKYCQQLWIHFFNQRLDEFPSNGLTFFNITKEFFFKCEWYEIYDFIEFSINSYKPEKWEEDESMEKLISLLNHRLKRELSAYRIVNNTVTEITSNEEISAIEESLQINDDFKPVKEHLKRALDHFSDRKNPDYRNSIKESISSIESLSSIITRRPKATLGQTLKEIEKSGKLHPALKSAFSNLYGYTSDANGIRHKLLDEDSIKQEDAKFMLVSCSAFINYLIQKISDTSENKVQNVHDG